MENLCVPCAGQPGQCPGQHRGHHVYSSVVADGRHGGACITLNDDGAIRYQFRTPAIRASRINPLEANNFANSIFGPSNNYEKPVITFADGEAIPADLLEEADAVCDRFTYDIGWQHGDVVLIDNTRVMHGRRRIEDKSRTIFNALSYAA
ncbi:Taurine catabolism dioxygenase TauD, TfdA family [Serratia plymuthica]|nr:Taurine catabolism dioxygenase TauD, TfdA family [Serratia plymuthica]